MESNAIPESDRFGAFEENMGNVFLMIRAALTGRGHIQAYVVQEASSG